MSFKIFALVRTTHLTKIFLFGDGSLMNNCAEKLIIEDEDKAVNRSGLENLQLSIFTKINPPFSKSSIKPSSELD